jgi:hypothetical protein
VEPPNPENLPATGQKAAPLAVHDEGPFSNLLDSGRFGHMWRIAQVFSKSNLVPAHFQAHPEDCFIGCQMAVRLGVDPFMFLQNTYVVHGRPGMEAKLAIALINSSGLFADSLDYEVVGDDPFDPAYKVRAFATRRSTGRVIQGPWVDWRLVKAERWDQRDGSKWKSMPSLMFQYRAATFFGRLHCPERLMGMQTADELQDTIAEQSPLLQAGYTQIEDRPRLPAALPPQQTASIEMPSTHYSVEPPPDGEPQAAAQVAPGAAQIGNGKPATRGRKPKAVQEPVAAPPVAQAQPFTPEHPGEGPEPQAPQTPAPAQQSSPTPKAEAPPTPASPAGTAATAAPATGTPAAGGGAKAALTPEQTALIQAFKLAQSNRGITPTRESNAKLFAAVTGHALDADLTKYVLERTSHYPDWTAKVQGLTLEQIQAAIA